MVRLSALLDREIGVLIEKGCDTFVCGGAVGFDTLAACRVIAAKKKHPHLRLVLVLPCRNQTEKWKRPDDIRLYQQIKGFSSQIIYAEETYTAGCMHKRNRMMADMSTYCIAYYNNVPRGGTAYTVKYAIEHGKTLVNLHDVIKYGNGRVK